MNKVTVALAAALMMVVAAPAGAQDDAEPTRVVEGFEGPSQAKDIGFRAIGNLALNGRVPGLEDRVMRTRVWTIQPGGVVPIHTHRNRPAFVYVLAGSIEEYRNTLPGPKRANAGDLSAEGLGIVHYWRNDGEVPAILFAVDLFQDPNFEPLEEMPSDMTMDEERM